MHRDICMKKKIILLSVALAAFLATGITALALLSGCGQPADAPSQTEAEEETVSWSTEEIVPPEEPEAKQTLWAEQYRPWEHKSQGTAEEDRLLYLDSGVRGSLFWYLGTVPAADGMYVFGPRGEYVLEIYDTATGEYTGKRFSPAELGLEGELGLLAGMDMPDEEHYMFRWMDYEQDDEGLYHQIADRMVYTDFAGDLQTADLWKVYLEKGIVREAFTELPLWQSVSCRCDGNGNSYVIDGNSRFYLFGKNGELLLEYKGSGQELTEPLRSPEGNLILPVYNSREKYYEFLLADTVEGELRSLGQAEASTPYITQLYGMLGEDIYYRSRIETGTSAGEGVVRWNIKSGTQEWLFDFQAAGIDMNYQTMLALQEGQPLFLRLTKFKEGKPEEWITSLTDQKPANDGAIRVADLTGSGERAEQCAVLASLETPDFHYEYEDASAQETRDRILAELSQGKGPDLLFVSLEDMYMLEEKGLLLDIGELISGELQEELLPGALEIGTLDGRLLGVPAAIRAETLAVSGYTWSKDTWRLEDIIDLMEEGTLAGTIRSPFVMSDYLTPALTVSTLVRYSLADSFLIDWENRKSHFDDERFIRLLELTGTDFSGAPQETERWLNDGQNILWGYFTVESDFLEFFVHMEEENGKIVGYPTEGACGSYLAADGGVLVVNANIDRKEAAACFLGTLLGEEMQSKTSSPCLSVRKLSPEDYLIQEESGRVTYLGGQELAVFIDGSTSLHRATDFLESCTAPPPGYSQIMRIISEELDAMYAENKSPRTAAEIINSRVQLYLDEGN